MKRCYWHGALVLAFMLLVLIGCGKKDLSPIAQAGMPLIYEADAVTPILGSVKFEPAAAVLSDGTIQMTYELVVNNASQSEFTIESLSVVNPEQSDFIISSFSRSDIKKMIYMPGAKPTATLGPSQCGYVRINLTFKNSEKTPRTLDHLLTVTTNKPVPPAILPKMIERVGWTRVSSEPLPLIGPPVKGDRWVAAVVGGEGYHRATIMPLNGRWVAPERWAVDYIRLDKENRLRTGDLTKNENYPQYNEKVIAVADGAVLDVKDGMPNETPPNMPENPTIFTAGGNYVLQDIGNGYAAFYAHLIPGSIKVSKGDRVSKGQVLGRLGSSGNSSGPHLHFHIVKGKSALTSDGAPYVIDSFKLKGYAESKDGLESEMKKGEAVNILPPKTSGKHKNEMPADLAVVEF